MMKKLLSLLLALAMLLGCTAFAEGVDYTGTWVLTGAEAEGVQMGPSMLAMIGLEQSMELSADGTLVMITVVPGEENLEESGTWVETETGIALVDDVQTINAVYQNEMLVIYEEASGAVMMYTREGAAPAVAEAAGPVVMANVDPKAFEGQWMLSTVNMMGMTFSAEQIGAYMAFVLSEGVGLYAETDENGEMVQLDVTYTVTEVEGTGTVLELLYSGEMAEEPVAIMSLNMLEDGSLYMGMDMEGMAIAYYFTQPAAE